MIKIALLALGLAVELLFLPLIAAQLSTMEMRLRERIVVTCPDGALYTHVIGDQMLTVRCDDPWPMLPTPTPGP